MYVPASQDRQTTHTLSSASHALFLPVLPTPLPFLLSLLTLPPLLSFTLDSETLSPLVLDVILSLSLPPSLLSLTKAESSCITPSA